MRALRPVVAVGSVLVLCLGGSVIATGSAGASGYTGGDAAGTPARPSGLLPPDQAWTVTLITGDVVRVRTVREGPPLVSVQPRPGRGNAIFSELVSASGQIEVLPQDVVPLLGRVLDPALFDVTTLIANGDDNAHRSYLPLIVRAQTSPAAAAAMTAAGLTLRPGMRASGTGTIAAREPRTDVARMGRTLAAMSAAVLRAGRVTPLVTRGIRHIWLARTVRASGGTQTGAATARAAAAPAVRLILKATPIPGTAPGQMSAYAYVVNIANPALFDREVQINSTGSATVRVPAGRYWVSGEIYDFTNLNAVRAAWAGQPEVPVTTNTTVALDAAAAVPVTASVTGHPTVMNSVGFHVERRFAGRVFGGLFGGDVFAFGPSADRSLFAQPTGTARTGTFHVATGFQLVSPAGTAQPYLYDLYHPVGTRVPTSLAYTVTQAEQARLARFDERFYAIDGNTAPIAENRYGLTPLGFATGSLNVQDATTVPGGSTLTEYLSTGGIRWDEETGPPLTGRNLAYAWAIERAGFTRYAPGSRHAAGWDRQPFRPGPYADPRLSASGCTPHSTVRFPGAIHVELVDLQDLPNGFDCLAFEQAWLQVTSRTMRLYRGDQLIGTARSSAGDFLVPAAPASYKLVYTDNTSRALPVSTQTRTSWTFHSAAPAGGNLALIPLLLVDYALPLGLNGHPDGRTAHFTVARVTGTPPAPVTGFKLWTSLDNGRTWEPAPVRALGGGRFTGPLPHAAPGQAVGLRVQATDAGGSGIEQTIMTAYHG